MVGNRSTLARPCSLAGLGAALLAGTLAFLGPGAPSAESRPSPPTWTCRDEVCQRATRSGETLTLELQNRRNRPTWVVLDPLELSNVKSLRPSPALLELGPGETRTAGLLAIEDATKPFAYQANWKALSGNPGAVHDDRWHYRMPFGGSSSITISQGYDGPFTHKGLGAYALDFPMPLDTPVLAARGGTIVETVDERGASGDPVGEYEVDNRVVIEHADGTFAIYAHLRHGGPARIGDHVESGDLIGLSGDTGFSTGPHLHFEVFKIRGDGQRQTIPVKFWNGTAKGFTALAGVEYAPGCPRVTGSPCRTGELASESPSDPPRRALVSESPAGVGRSAQSAPAGPTRDSTPASPMRRPD